MRITRLFAVLSAVVGLSAVSPASAETALARAAPIATPFAQPAGSDASTDQYRDRGYRGGYGRGYRGGYGHRGWNRGYYRRNYYAYRPYRWRGGRMVCRTSWRWGRPHRVCFRRW